MTDRSKSLGFPNGNGEKIFQGETRLFGVCQDFTERYASIMERKRGIEQSIITEFDLISPFIEDMGNTGIDYVIDTRIVHYFPISVIPIGGVAERYPTIRKRLAEEYFLPKMSLFFSKWKEYLYEKVASWRLLNHKH